MNPPSLTSPAGDDATLVAQSLSGDRSAFSRIVARYQSLICSLAFSATGSLPRSEDLAQDTFLTAWKSLRNLREPGKLRSWLCGIARNSILGEFRRLGREPAHAATSLEGALQLPASDPQPAAQAISSEEAALLWREVSQLPTIYREPLVLFYRQNQSVAAVAQSLDLSEDAVLQRLSRGRKMLHERMLSFVEDALARTTPGRHFTLGVEAALPILAVSTSVTSTSALAKGGVAVKSGGFLGLLATLLVQFANIFASIGLTWYAIHDSATPRERRFTARWMLALWCCVLVFALSFYGIASLNRGLAPSSAPDWRQTFPTIALWWGYCMVLAVLFVLLFRGKAAIRRLDSAEGTLPAAATAPRPLHAQIGAVFTVCVCCFSAPIVVAWQSGDRPVATILAAFVFLFAVGVTWHSYGRLRKTADGVGIFILAAAAVVNLALVNWRLDVWLAPVCRVDLATMHQLLPMSIIHALSAILVLWTFALLALTKPATPSDPSLALRNFSVGAPPPCKSAVTSPKTVAPHHHPV